MPPSPQIGGLYLNHSSLPVFFTTNPEKVNQFQNWLRILSGKSSADFKAEISKLPMNTLELFVTVISTSNLSQFPTTVSDPPPDESESESDEDSQDKEKDKQKEKDKAAKTTKVKKLQKRKQSTSDDEDEEMLMMNLIKYLKNNAPYYSTKDKPAGNISIKNADLTRLVSLIKDNLLKIQDQTSDSLKCRFRIALRLKGFFLFFYFLDMEKLFSDKLGQKGSKKEVKSAFYKYIQSQCGISKR